MGPGGRYDGIIPNLYTSIGGMTFFAALVLRFFFILEGLAKKLPSIGSDLIDSITVLLMSTCKFDATRTPQMN